MKIVKGIIVIALITLMSSCAAPANSSEDDIPSLDAAAPRTDGSTEGAREAQTMIRPVTNAVGARR